MKLSTLKNFIIKNWLYIAVTAVGLIIAFRSCG